MHYLTGLNDACYIFVDTIIVRTWLLYCLILFLFPICTQKIFFIKLAYLYKIIQVIQPTGATAVVHDNLKKKSRTQTLL